MLLNASSRFPRGLSQIGRRLLQIFLRHRLFFKPSFTSRLLTDEPVRVWLFRGHVGEVSLDGESSDLIQWVVVVDEL